MSFLLLVRASLQGIELDDWLSDTEDSGETDTGEEDANEDTGEKLVRWATIALEGTAANAPPVAASRTATPADLVAKCQENAARRRQKIQKLRDLRKKEARESNLMAPLRESAEPGAERNIKPRTSVTDDANRRSSDKSESEDEMENLYKTASRRVHAKDVPVQKIPIVPASCIRFDPNHQPDLELSNNSRQAALKGFQHAFYVSRFFFNEKRCFLLTL